MKNKLIYTILIVTLAILLAPNAFAQEKKEDGKCKLMSREQFEKRKMDYIVKETELTKEETEKFIPLLQRMNKKSHYYHDKVRQLFEKERKGEVKTDAEYEKMVRDMAKYMNAERDVETQYLDSFLQVISAKKYYKFKTCEFKFIHQMMRARGRRRNPNNAKRNPNCTNKDNKEDRNPPEEVPMSF